jgi:hypothetical protein
MESWRSRRYQMYVHQIYFQLILTGAKGSGASVASVNFAPMVRTNVIAQSNGIQAVMSPAPSSNTPSRMAITRRAFPMVFPTKRQVRSCAVESRRTLDVKEAASSRDSGLWVARRFLRQKLTVSGRDWRRRWTRTLCGAICKSYGKCL